MDIQSYNDIYGTTSNPWDLTRTPGGSSGGGSSAVAAGISSVEFGGDVGGSIRTPAAFCGIFGHKPTYGLIPKRGPHLTLKPKEISVRGILARTARDLRLMLDCVAVPDRSTVGNGWSLNLPKPLDKPLGKNYRVAIWADDPACRVDDDVRFACEQLAWTLRSRGVHVDTNARPKFDVMENLDTYRCLTAANAVLNDASVSSDNAGVTLRRYRLAQESQSRIREAWGEFFQEFNFLLCPSHPTPAFKKDESPKAGRQLELVVDGYQTKMPYWRSLFWAILTNVGLLPSTTFPCGFGERTKLPIGLNVVGPEWSDLRTIGFANLLETECACKFRAPPGFSSQSPSRL